MRNISRSLIRLADNPVEPEKFYTDEDDSQEDGDMNDRTNKGRAVRGPRTKLASADRFDRIERAVGTLAASVQQLAKANQAMMKAGGFDVMDDYDEDQDPMDVEMPDDEDEDELQLADEDGYIHSDFDPYGGEDDLGEPEEEPTEQELPTNKARVNRARVNRARLSKDDAASSFGEEDDDVPGNRPLDADNKDRPASDYVIQGGSDAGPGPVSKAVLSKAVRAELVKMGIVKSAKSPAAAGASSKISKADPEPSMMDLVDSGRKLSFQQLNRARFDGTFAGGFGN